MQTTFSMLFYLKKPKKTNSELFPIYLRLTVDGIRAELSTGRDCHPGKWNKYLVAKKLRKNKN